MNKFRTLRADEIDCRISQVKKDGSGLTLLLYKDARCDQNILDETVGPMNWERRHSRENANCTVSIWDAEKQMWISKEDTGTESNTEKEKGLASDSFKRACFNWGIGRELYTAPFIWIKKGDFNLKEGKCYDRFTVHGIGYANGVITGLEIKNQATGKICYKFGKITEKAPEKPEQPDNDPGEPIPQSAPVHPQSAAPATVTTQATVPPPVANPVPPEPPAPETPKTYMSRRIAEFKEKKADFNFLAARKALIDGGVIKDIPSATMSMEQAVELMDAIEKNLMKKAG